jgi:glycosyltransferase involved in cell wall biosynthesis
LHGLLIATLFKDQNLIAQHHGGSWPMKHVKEVKRYKLFFPVFLFGQLWENKVLKYFKIFYALSIQEIEYLKKRALKSKIIFQTMGIDDFYFSKPLDKKISRKKLKWPLDKKIILYIGRINHTKGTKYIIDAMEKLKDIELKIIGWGDEELFKDYVKSKKLKNVEFLGPIFGKEKLPYLAAVDAFVLPSTKEGASVSTMEALAQNLPVVTTDVAGMPLMIKNDENGIVIKQRNSKEIVNAVRKIINWKKKNITKSAERYKWGKIINNTVEDYKNI